MGWKGRVETPRRKTPHHLLTRTLRRSICGQDVVSCRFSRRQRDCKSRECCSQGTVSGSQYFDPHESQPQNEPPNQHSSPPTLQSEAQLNCPSGVDIVCSCGDLRCSRDCCSVPHNPRLQLEHRIGWTICDG